MDDVGSTESQENTDVGSTESQENTDVGSTESQENTDVGQESADRELERLREQVSTVDSKIIEAFNERLGLVAQIKRHKDEHGIAFIDPDRERWMFDHQSRTNRGPLSDEGLRELYGALLALTKREVG